MSAGVGEGTGRLLVEMRGEGEGTGSGRMSAGRVGATGGRGVDGREGEAGIIIEAASMGRIGRGARMGGDATPTGGKGGAGGSAMVVAVAASRTLKAFSAKSDCGRVCCSGSGSSCGSDVEGNSFFSKGSGRHSTFVFWHVGHTQSLDL
jgi:hypothetical protein